ncbi:DUF29 family protein [Thermosynechococcus vestitus]|uniref:Tsr2120 protein n=1 Tax=Thermosynechococcus vestitus (strain NIES-2133 / IAM M-273 / BP-1) TaxID=197221 RepID=Q8DH40_THEVB|nr:tsr2120 [Thermosynechococcus vestitus BP-1]
MGAKAGDFGHLDIAHFVEEIKTLARQKHRELENCLGELPRSLDWASPKGGLPA